MSVSPFGVITQARTAERRDQGNKIDNTEA